MPGRLYRWFDERLALGGMKDVLAKKTVPEHRWSFLYHLGGATLFLFGVQVASGILLALFYRPSAAEAHASVRHVITNVPFGDLVRSVHAWSADLFVGLLFAHLFVAWLTRAYRSPRELTWLVGCGLFVLGICLAFTGYLLPWSELSYFATRVGTEIAGHVPFIGDWLRTFLRGGEEVGGLTLARFFSFHIALLPATATLLLVGHLLFVQRLGISAPESPTKPIRTVPFYPVSLVRDLFYWLVLLAILATLATYFPRALGKEADPFAAAPEHIKPEWYFLFVFQTLKLLPARIFGIAGETIGIFTFLGAYLFAILLPVLDRRGHRLFKIAGWLALTYFAGFTAYGWLD